jgi:hypothetical protein
MDPSYPEIDRRRNKYDRRQVPPLARDLEAVIAAAFSREMQPLIRRVDLIEGTIVRINTALQIHEAQDRVARRVGYGVLGAIVGVGGFVVALLTFAYDRLR